MLRLLQICCRFFDKVQQCKPAITKALQGFVAFVADFLLQFKNYINIKIFRE